MLIPDYKNVGKRDSYAIAGIHCFKKNAYFFKII